MKKGFTLLLTLIVMSVALVAGLGVFSIILRETELSGLGRESQIAFYAADSGVECVLYWDIKKKAISTTTLATIQCLGQSPTVGGALISSFNLNFNNGACAKVVVNKTNSSVTRIDSYGYNFDCDSSRSRKVERGVRITY